MSSLTTLPIVGEESAADRAGAYVAYSYSYPHKSAYEAFRPPVPLTPVWQAEDRRSLFLYFHLPFCEMRCGFCNLFARANAGPDLIDAYLDTLERQARALDQATQGGRAVARLALGGGTPTILSPQQLDRVFDIADRYFQGGPSSIPASVETSPQTATPSALRVLKDRGVERVSIGIQSFVETEVHAVGRPQSTREVHAALERLRAFPVLNIDLIYGLPAQTHSSWLGSIRNALAYVPEEIYLYPLYVRPQTGIGRRGQVRRPADSFLRSLYRAARDLLLSQGYQQVSMRYFRLPGRSRTGPVYCCQTDGMIGLGCGARSYTTWLHYANRFAVDAGAIQAILQDWVGQSDQDLAYCHWGVHLSLDDRRRRFLIQSLLTRDGLKEADYLSLFGARPLIDFPELDLLREHGLATCESACWLLTAAGFELSDWIGPRLYSAPRRRALEEFARI